MSSGPQFHCLIDIFVDFGITPLIFLFFFSLFYFIDDNFVGLNNQVLDKSVVVVDIGSI